MRKNLVLNNTKELNKVSSTELSILYCYNLKTLEWVKKKPYIRINTRELNRELCIRLSTLYTKPPCSVLLLF